MRGGRRHRQRAVADARRGSWRRWARPTVWINCAGNGVYGRFATVPEQQFDQVTAVTYGGTVNGCRAALRLMTPSGQGTIVNVCSAVAFHGLPLMTSYAGAKAAVRGFAQALRAELRIERSAIRVSTVFPPAVNTPFFSHAVSHMGWPARPAPPVYQPEVVAAGIYLAAIHAPAELVVSGTAALFSLAQRVSPRLIAYAMTRLGFDTPAHPGAAGVAAGAADAVPAVHGGVPGAWPVRGRRAAAQHPALGQPPRHRRHRVRHAARQPAEGHRRPGAERPCGGCGTAAGDAELAAGMARPDPPLTRDRLTPCWPRPCTQWLLAAWFRLNQGCLVAAAQLVAAVMLRELQAFGRAA